MRWKRRGESVSWVRNRSFVQPHQARQQALTRRWRKTYDQVPSAHGTISGLRRDPSQLADDLFCSASFLCHSCLLTTSTTSSY